MKEKLVWYIILITLTPWGLLKSVDQKGHTVLIPQKWLILGAFTSDGSNAFYQNFLSQTEDSFSPEPGGPGNILGDSLPWVKVSVDEKGFVDLSKSSRQRPGKQIAYAYTTWESAVERRAVFTFGHTGSLEVWLNGRSVYRNRISRNPEPDRDVVVVNLNKGKNKILVKCEGTPPYFGFYLRVYSPPGKVYVNTSATIIPDFQVGKRVQGWGQLEVANVSGDSLQNISVSVIGNNFIIPGTFTEGGMRADEVRRIPFWIASRSEVSDSAAEAFTINVIDQSISLVPRIRQRNEYFVTTYRSALDGSVQPYSLLVPISYRSDTAYPLIVLLHGAWVTDWGQNIISYDRKEWAIQVAVHDRGNNRYRDVGEVDLNEVLYHVKKQYRIDEDRMFLAGHSMGGYGTWYQAVRHPDRWSAISPQAGYTDYFLYHPMMSNSNGQSAFQRQLLTEWSPLLFAENLLHVPSYIIHGAKDDNVLVEHSRKMAARLQELNYQFIYDENPDAGHWWGPRGTYYGVEVVDKPPIWSFFQQNIRRVKKPKRVIYKTNTLRYNQAYWLTIDELDTVYRMASFSAEISDDNKLNIKTDNITQFTLELESMPINPDNPMNIYINSMPLLSDYVPNKRRLAFRKENDHIIGLFYPEMTPANMDRTVEQLPLATYFTRSGKIQEIHSFPAQRFKKSPAIFGPVVDAFNTPFLFVIGTQHHEAAVKNAIREAALRFAKSWESMANGRVNIQLDTELSNEDIFHKNLILFGTHTSNTVIARVFGELPIQIFPDRVRIGKDFLAGQDIGAVFVYPNPLNHRKYVVVISGSTADSYRLATRLHLPELPDYVVFDRTSFASPETEYRRAGFFDKHWKLSRLINGDEKK